MKKSMNKKKLNNKDSFLVLNEETYPIMEKLDELVEELKKIETQEELLQKVQTHITKVIL